MKLAISEVVHELEGVGAKKATVLGKTNPHVISEPRKKNLPEPDKLKS